MTVPLSKVVNFIVFALFCLWQFCPLHLAILKHSNLTKTLPGNQQFRGLEKAEKLLKTKSRHSFGNGGFYTGPRTQVEILWITPRSPQGDIVQVDYACLSRLIGHELENQFLHVCEGEQ